MFSPLPPPRPPPPIQGKKVHKPPTPPPYYFFFPVLINLDCKTLCGLIRDDLFPNWQFGLVIYHQLRDLQLLVLDRELFTLYSNSFGRTDSIVFDKLNEPPSLISRPPVSIKPPSNVSETNKPPGSLIEDLR